MPRHTLLPFALLLLPPAMLSAQSPSKTSSQTPDAPITTLRATAHLVVVDVVVTDRKGHPIRNLSPADFTILENGKKQTLAHVEEHTPETPPGPEQPIPKLPLGTFTNFSPAPTFGAVNILLLDALNTPLEDQAFVHQEMIKYLKTPHPGSQMAIFGLNAQLRLLQGFTSDPDILRAVLSGKKAGLEMSSVLDNPETSNTDQPLVSTATDTSGVDLGSSPQADIIAANYAQFNAERMSFNLSLRTRVTLEGLDILARYLSGIPGRKNLIWFSGSFPVNILPDGNLRYPFAAAESMADEFRATADLLARSQVSVYPIDARGLMGGSLAGGINTGDNFGAQTQTASQYATSQDSMALQDASGRTTMTLMAEQTGGKAFINTNDLNQAVTQAIQNGSTYYTLSYSPADKDWKGDYRKLEIRLAKSGYTLSYRRGYFADEPGASTHANQPTHGATAYDPMRTAMLFGGPDPVEIVFSATVHPVTGTPEPELAPDNRAVAHTSGPYTRYSVLFRVDPRTLTAQGQPNGDHHLDLGFATYVYDDKGKLVTTVASRVANDLNQAHFEAMQQEGLAYTQQISVPTKGEYFLRIGIEDGDSHRVGALEIPVSRVARLPPAKP